MHDHYEGETAIGRDGGEYLLQSFLAASGCAYADHETGVGICNGAAGRFMFRSGSVHRRIIVFRGGFFFGQDLNISIAGRGGEVQLVKLSICIRFNGKINKMLHAGSSGWSHGYKFLSAADHGNRRFAAKAASGSFLTVALMVLNFVNIQGGIPCP
jgi:hypothetical protein